MENNTILIVDDMEDNRILLKKAFSDSPYVFIEAANGSEAYEQAQRHNPSLVLMDLLMPQSDGFESIRMIRTDPEITQMPILVLTALDTHRDRLRALEIGATDFIAKPFDITELRARVNSLTTMQISLQQKEKSLLQLNNTLEARINEKSRELKRLYLTDHLTGLPNRDKLLKDIQKERARGVMLVDIDSFSEIANFYGTGLSDELLKQVGRRLSSLCLIEHQCYDVYRYHADIFAVSFTDENPAELAGDIVADIKSRPFRLFEDFELNIFVTVGAANGEETVLSNAEIALREAKLKKEDFGLFQNDNSVIKEYENNLLWTKKILRAINQDKIIPYFQPIFNLENKEVEKYECLIRLIDEEGVVNSPAKFMDISKKSKLYPQLTRIMIAKAFETFSDVDTHFSLNLSSEDITNEKTAQIIFAALESFPKKEKVVFEILESDSIKNYDSVIRFIDRVKSYGCKIAIDDFGSGYSNFAHILKLNVDYIKLDGSLIKNIHTDTNSHTIVETIIDFSKKLGFKTVAEFVHCKEVLDALEKLGIDYIQGNYCGAAAGELQRKSLATL